MSEKRKSPVIHSVPESVPESPEPAAAAQPQTDPAAAASTNAAPQPVGVVVNISVGPGLVELTVKGAGKPVKNENRAIITDEKQAINLLHALTEGILIAWHGGVQK